LNIVLRIKVDELTVIEGDKEEENQEGEEVEGGNNEDWKTVINEKILKRYEGEKI
jgi:hypothetical protein